MYVLIGPQDSAANVVRFAKAVHKEAPYLLQGVATLSAISLPRAEEGIHNAISDWQQTLPMDIYLWNRGLIFAPMLRATTWCEYLLVKHPKILLGGFDRQHPAVPAFLKAFWTAFAFEEPSHEVYVAHADSLDSCVPVAFYSDEGRGLRKTPIQICGLETMFSVESFAAFEKSGAKKNSGTTRFSGRYKSIHRVDHHFFPAFFSRCCLTNYTAANATKSGIKFARRLERIWQRCFVMASTWTASNGSLC